MHEALSRARLATRWRALVLDRDVNAARNVLKRGLEIGRGLPEYTPEGEETATQLSGAGQVASVNQEAHDLSHG